MWGPVLERSQSTCWARQNPSLRLLTLGACGFRAEGINKCADHSGDAERDPGVKEGVCALYRETGEHQSSHQPRHAGREREGELGAGGCLCGAGANTRRTDNHVSSLQVYKERQKYCKEWRKRKRMVSENPRVALEAWEVPITREVSVQNDPAGSALYCCPPERGFVSCQTTELCDAILEGYPKSKKQFFVSDSFSCSPGIFAQRTPPFLSLPHRRKLG